MKPGEQQVAETLEGIRKDHRARYAMAARMFAGKRLVDIGCGVGYGSKILSDSGCRVKAVDIDPEAIEYGKKYYDSEKVDYVVGNAEHFGPFPGVDAGMCFEMIEHLKNPLPMLKRINKTAPVLLASVPNELIFPHKGKYLYHHRHYTPAEFEDLLNRAGYEVREWWGQEGPESEPEPNKQGRTIIALCDRSDDPRGGTAEALGTPPRPIPQSVAIVAMGKSCATYVRQCSAAGNRFLVADETWCINSIGHAVVHDLLFHMDDLEVQERRGDLKPDSNVGNMIRWLKHHPRFYTSRPREGYPGAMEYPLDQIMKRFGVTYLNSTVAYAVAYAMMLGVKRINLYGCDYSYTNLHKAERGRGCVEFWLGMAAARGHQIVVAEDSTLLDASVPNAERFYGYDAYQIEVKLDKEKGVYVEKSLKDSLPTAEEIEHRYNYEPPIPAAKPADQKAA